MNLKTIVVVVVVVVGILPSKGMPKRRAEEPPLVRLAFPSQCNLSHRGPSV